MEDIDYTNSIPLTPSILPPHIFEEMESNCRQFTSPPDLSAFRIEEWNYKSKLLVLEYGVKLIKKRR